MIHDIIHGRIFLLALTVAVYYGSGLLYKKWKTPLLNPFLISIIVIIGVLLLLGIDFTEYYEANSILNFLLGLSVVALGYLMEKHYSRIRDNILPILASTFAGSVVAVASVWGIAWLMGADEVVIASLKPKTVTMPIAVSIAEHTGGLPSLVSLGVILAGVSGSVFGPWLLKVFGVGSSVARGLALGSASHAVGTARAIEMGAVEGAVGGAAVGIMGLMTAIIIPVLNAIFQGPLQ